MDKVIKINVTMVVAGFVMDFLLMFYESLYVIHTPSSPPAVLVKSDIMRSSTPNREGAYPPAMEPTIIPNIISFFRDIIWPCRFYGRDPAMSIMKMSVEVKKKNPLG